MLKTGNFQQHSSHITFKNKSDFCNERCSERRRLFFFGVSKNDETIMLGTAVLYLLFLWSFHLSVIMPSLFTSIKLDTMFTVLLPLVVSYTLVLSLVQSVHCFLQHESTCALLQTTDFTLEYFNSTASFNYSTLSLTCFKPDSPL